MNLVVLLKQTFDTEEKIELVNGAVAEDSVKFIINPYDEYALEEVLRLREIHGGTVTAVSCGPERAAEALRTALAMGADDAVLLDAAGLPDDGHAVASALAAVVQQLQPDLVLAGLFAIDSGAGSVALQIAERLGLPSASAAVKVELCSANSVGGARGTASAAGRPAGGDGAESVAGGAGSTAGGTAASAASWVSSMADHLVRVERDTEWGLETVEVPLPALITAQQGLNEPRYPSLPGIMKAKRKPLRRIAIAELGLAAVDLEPRTERLALTAPPARSAGRKLSGTPAEQAAALADLLQHEAKIF
ncbi:electron transfer flavoprotein subunit beta/FixA family protein [Paenibacillus sp. sptzw28]|uniref:electron transfer flavoprotein subunit beta/FixA family protein n=1 Tax=Paenibacillus sp. sptzw28 TaxID=715179 RepID=UPI001C6E93C2|nr:electron transfer flavoprotein subunit beta/FixA family protein [Paenibacillus sp. sptzw28]QYR21254.1 electron transfer flavoprotein subunit beta/FixA family protein [Paenibacillus sp. sptzw28]